MALATAPAARSPLVELRGVTKRYSNGLLAVGGVDLDLGSGEFVSLLGPSGCGKSTLLRLIAGLGEVSGGSICRPAANDESRDAPVRDISFVFQDATLMPWATALQNVMLPLKLQHLAKHEASERSQAVLAAVGLGAFQDAYPRELSGGMKMRVSIARALVTEPRLLLMDEPFAALDEITRHKLNDDLLTLWEKSRFTVLFVTHSVFESVYLSQRVVVMAARPGRVLGEVRIDARVPRPPSFRTSSTYVETCNVVSTRLEEAIGV
jgi:NitT/TauT family transport system ATP-binding protein